jgi:glycine cleavage system H protein
MANLNHPGNVKYSQTDEWVRLDGDSAYVGISDYAQDQLGDIVYIELHGEAGQKLAHEDKFGDVESVKATSELLSPISGEIVALNENLKDHPELINDDPYDKGWIMHVKLSNPDELNDLMDVDSYLKYIENR